MVVTVILIALLDKHHCSLMTCDTGADRSASVLFKQRQTIHPMLVSFFQLFLCVVSRTVDEASSPQS